MSDKPGTRFGEVERSRVKFASLGGWRAKIGMQARRISPSRSGLSPSHQPRSHSSHGFLVLSSIHRWQFLFTYIPPSLQLRVFLACTPSAIVSRVCEVACGCHPVAFQGRAAGLRLLLLIPTVQSLARGPFTLSRSLSLSHSLSRSLSLSLSLSLSASLSLSLSLSLSHSRSHSLSLNICRSLCIPDLSLCAVDRAPRPHGRGARPMVTQGAWTRSDIVGG